MVELLPQPPAAVEIPLRGVLDKALTAGAKAPPWVVVEDDQQRWLLLAASAPATERAHAVAVVNSDTALAHAVRLGIGGALAMPPSTVAMGAALEAAAAGAADPKPVCDPGVVELVASGGGAVTAVGWQRRAFWRLQLGESALCSLLLRLARELEAAPAVISWPALIVAGRGEDEILSAWRRVASRRLPAPSQAPGVKPLSEAALASGVTAAVVHALIEWEAGHPARAEPQPVFALPGGRQVGSWAPTETDDRAEGGWLAFPAELGFTGCRWTLRHPDREDDEVRDVVQPEQIGDRDLVALRLAGWAANRVRSGSPSGLLVDRLIAATRRRRLPLWVPNVDTETLHFLLRLDGELWVDGPAVPGRGGVEG